MVYYHLEQPHKYTRDKLLEMWARQPRYAKPIVVTITCAAFCTWLLGIFGVYVAFVATEETKSIARLAAIFFALPLLFCMFYLLLIMRGFRKPSYSKIRYALFIIAVPLAASVITLFTAYQTVAYTLPNTHAFWSTNWEWDYVEVLDAEIKRGGGTRNGGRYCQFKIEGEPDWVNTLLKMCRNVPVGERIPVYWITTEWGTRYEFHRQRKGAKKSDLNS